jgi:hypothetical protein
LLIVVRFVARIAPGRRPTVSPEGRSSGSWRAIVYAGKDPLTGKRRLLRESAPTYADAKVVLIKLQRQVDEDQHSKTAITVARAVEAWLKVAELAATTRERYDDLVRVYITPTFGELSAAKLDASCWSGSTPG